MGRILTAVAVTVCSAAVLCAYDKLTVAGETAANGIYDPSLEYAQDGMTGYLAYSSVQFPAYVHTNIAVTGNNGVSWTKTVQVNTSVPDTLEYIDGSRIDGVWRHEVATLVHDPTDPDPGRRWKLFWHHYFTQAPYEAEDRLAAYGWIAYKYAASPEGPWSAEEALFGAGLFPPAPYDFTRLDINALHPDLDGHVGYTEPGSICLDGILYISLSSLSLTGACSIILLRSTDHAYSWEYAGTVLDTADARALGYVRFDGTSLAADNGRLFLLGTAETDSVLHDGMIIFEFDDIATGAIRRDSTGVPVIYDTIRLQQDPVSARIGGGQGDYDEDNTGGGIIISRLDLLAAADDFFQVIQTDRRIVIDSDIRVVPVPPVARRSGSRRRFFDITGRPVSKRPGIVIIYQEGGGYQKTFIPY